MSDYKIKKIPPVEVDEEILTKVREDISSFCEEHFHQRDYTQEEIGDAFINIIKQSFHLLDSMGVLEDFINGDLGLPNTYLESRPRVAELIKSLSITQRQIIKKEQEMGYFVAFEE